MKDITIVYNSTIEFSEKHPFAFSCLPECYQNDDVLDYYEDETGLYAQAKPDQVFAIGETVWVFNYTQREWETTEKQRF